MNTDILLDDSHISAITMKDATGTDFMVTMYGHKRSSKVRKRPEIMARRAPRRNARKNPEAILRRLNHKMRKKSASPHIANSRDRAFTGEARRILLSSAIAAACHTAMARRKAAAFKIYCFALLLYLIIKIAFGKRTADRLGVLLKKYAQIALHRFFHIAAGDKGDIAERNGFFRYCGFK